MAAATDVVSLGEPLYEFSQIPGQDRQYLQGFGGDTSNASIAAARQGARVAYVTRVGDDEFGKQFLALWRAEGLDTSGVGIDREAHTAVYFIQYGPQGHEFSYLRAGSAASRMQPAHLPLALIRGAKFFGLRYRLRRHRRGEGGGRKVRLRFQPSTALVAGAPRQSSDHRHHSAG